MFFITVKRRFYLHALVLSVFLAGVFTLFAGAGGSLGAAPLMLPAPQELISITQPVAPPTLKGIQLYPKDPLTFDFIIDEGDRPLNAAAFEAAARRLITYFLAALTIPDEELWVNLSPYEKDQVATEALSATEMGKDLLSADYVLKQLFASLTYPESEQGKAFWDAVHKKAHDTFGDEQVPINIFNKIWIVPQKAVVYENRDSAILGESRLKVMLQEDYLALKHNVPRLQAPDAAGEQVNNVSSEIVREMVLPVIEQEVNSGENFAVVRQVYSALVLASWFKQKMKESILNKVYVDKKKLQGTTADDPQAKQKIYEQYMKAYQKGVYNYVRREFDGASRTYIKRKYVSGGMFFAGLKKVTQTKQLLAPAAFSSSTLQEDQTPPDMFAGRSLTVRDGTLVSSEAPGQMSSLPLPFVELSDKVPELKAIDTVDLALAALNSAAPQNADRLADDMALDLFSALPIDDIAVVFSQMGLDMQLAGEVKKEFLEQQDTLRSFADFAARSAASEIKTIDFAQDFSQTALRTLPAEKTVPISEITLSRAVATFPDSELARFLQAAAPQDAGALIPKVTAAMDELVSSSGLMEVTVQLVPSNVSANALSRRKQFKEYLRGASVLQQIDPVELTQALLVFASAENRKWLAQSITGEAFENLSEKDLAVTLESMGIPSPRDTAARIKKEYSFQQEAAEEKSGRRLSFIEYARTSSQEKIINAADFTEKFSSALFGVLPEQITRTFAQYSIPEALSSLKEAELKQAFGSLEIESPSFLIEQVKRVRDQLIDEAIPARSGDSPVAVDEPEALGGIDLSPRDFTIEVQGEGLRLMYLDSTFELSAVEGFTVKILQMKGI